MAIKIVENPLASGGLTLETSYTRQNTLLSLLLQQYKPNLSTSRVETDVSTTMNIKKDSTFVCRGNMYITDVDYPMVIPSVSPTLSKIYYLLFDVDRNELQLTTTSPTNRYDPAQQGYYQDKRMYLEIAVARHYPGSRHFTNKLDIVQMQNYQEGEFWVQRGGTPSPNRITLSQWTEVSQYYPGYFERIAGGESTPFNDTNRGDQEDAQQKVVGLFHVTEPRGKDLHVSGAFSKRYVGYVNRKAGDGAATNMDLITFDSSKSPGIRIAEEVRPINKTVRLWCCHSRY